MIRLLWPGHWIFHRHPLFSQDRHHPDRMLWDSWAAFQVGLHRTVCTWYEGQHRGGMQPATLEPYLPSKSWLIKASELGVTWSLDEKTLCMLSDPIRYHCLHQV